ncbi:MAG: hypothetical protein ACLTQI_04320 [Slackia sp.]
MDMRLVRFRSRARRRPVSDFTQVTKDAAQAEDAVAADAKRRPQPKRC